jgi:hypothetical protein
MCVSSIHNMKSFQPLYFLPSSLAGCWEMVRHPRSVKHRGKVASPPISYLEGDRFRFQPGDRLFLLALSWSSSGPVDRCRYSALVLILSSSQFINRHIIRGYITSSIESIFKLTKNEDRSYLCSPICHRQVTPFGKLFTRLLATCQIKKIRNVTFFRVCILNFNK